MKECFEWSCRCWRGGGHLNSLFFFLGWWWWRRGNICLWLWSNVPPDLKWLRSKPANAGGKVKNSSQMMIGKRGVVQLKIILGQGGASAMVAYNRSWKNSLNASQNKKLQAQTTLVQVNSENCHYRVFHPTCLILCFTKLDFLFLPFGCFSLPHLHHT